MTDYCDGLGKCLKGFAATPPDAPMADNQQRAAEILTAPHPRTDINPYWRRDILAAALDAAEARGRAEVAAKVEALHSPIDHGTGPQCQGCATSVTFTRWPCKTIAALRGES